MGNVVVFSLREVAQEIVHGLQRDRSEGFQNDT